VSKILGGLLLDVLTIHLMSVLVRFVVWNLVFKDSKCQASSQEERDAAADYVKDSDEMIDELKAELMG
jgi:hypothetical protein